MKKKLLSLVLAGAMVASTSVSAFADTTVPTRDVTILENQTEQNVDVDITGTILDSQGNAKPGTINVSVPTAATFSVNGTTGALTSSDMVITNNSDEGIIVIASKFEDSNGAEDINIVKRTDFVANGANSENNRGTVWLRLTGGTNNIGLASNNKGEMYDNDYQQKIEEAQNQQIGTINAREKMTLQLEGAGGTKDGDPSTPIRDTFKLVLKVKRAR